MLFQRLKIFCFIIIGLTFFSPNLYAYDIHKEIPLSFIYQGADAGGVDLSTGWFPVILCVTDAEGYLNAGNTPVSLAYSAKLIIECNSSDFWPGNQVPCRAWIETVDHPDYTELSSNFGLAFGIRFRDWWFEEEFASIGNDFGMNISTDGPMPLGPDVMCGIDYLDCSALPLSEMIGTVSKAASTVVSNLGEGIDMVSLSLAGELVVEGNYLQMILGGNDPVRFTGFGVENAKPFFIYIPQDPYDSDYYDPENDVLTFSPTVQYSLNLYRTMGIRLTLVGPLAFDIMPNILSEAENAEDNIMNYNCPVQETLHNPDLYKKVADDFKIGGAQNLSVSFPFMDRPFLPDMEVTDIILGSGSEGRIFGGEWSGIDFTITNLGERASESTASFVYTIKIDGEYAKDPFGYDLQDRRLEDLDGNLIVLAPNESYTLRSFSWPFAEGLHTLEFRVGYIEFKGNDSYGNPIYALADYNVSNNVVVKRIYAHAPRGTVIGRVITNPCGFGCYINGIGVRLTGVTSGGEVLTRYMETANDGASDGVFRFENIPDGDYRLEYVPPVPTKEDLEKGAPFYAPRSFLFHHDSSATDDFNYATNPSGMFLTQFQRLKGTVEDEKGKPIEKVKVEMGDVALKSTLTVLESAGEEIVEALFSFENESPRGTRTIRFDHDLYESGEIEYTFSVSDSYASEQWVNASYWDRQDQQYKSGPVVLSLDETPPSIFVAPLANEGFVGSALSFSLASSDGVKATASHTYRIYSDGTELKAGTWVSYETADQETLVPVSADLTGLVDGSYTLFVDARDRAGNVASSETIAFIKDTAAPSISVVLKDPTTHLSTGTDSKSVDVEVTVTNTEAGRLAVELSNDQSAWSEPKFFTGTSVTIPSWQIIEKDVFTGTKTVYVRITDLSGNSSIGSDAIDVDTTGSVVLNRGSKYINNASGVPLEIKITPPDGSMLYVEYTYGDVLALGAADGILYRAQELQFSQDLSFNVIKVNIQDLVGNPGSLHVKVVTNRDDSDPSCGQYELVHWTAPADEVRHSRGLYNGKYVMFLQDPITLPAGTYYLLVYAESGDSENYYTISAGNANSQYGGHGYVSYEYIDGSWETTPEPIPEDVLPTLSFEVWDNSTGEIRIALDGVLDDETWQPYRFPMGMQYVDFTGSGVHAVCVDYRNTYRPAKDGIYCDTICVDRAIPSASATIESIDRVGRNFYLKLSASDTESGLEAISWRIAGGEWSPYVPYAETLKIENAPSFRTLEIKFRDTAGNEQIVTINCDEDIYPPEIQAFTAGDGSGFTRNPEVNLHIEATDNFDIIAPVIE